MNDNYKTYEEYDQENGQNVNNDENIDQSLYNDGADKNPKLVIIIAGIILLIIIILIFFFACSKLNDKSDNNYLNNISITNGELTPEYNRDTLNYTINTQEEIVTVKCSSESSKAITSGCNKRIYLTDACVEHVIKVVSESKKERKYTLNICKTNQSVPTIKKVNISPTGYTKDKVTVTIEAESESSLHKEAYSIDDGLTWQTSNKFTITENKILYIKVRDENNTQSLTTIKEINNIDKSKVTVEVKGSVGSGVSTTSNVELTAFVTPSTSVSGYKYQWYKNNSKISKATNSTYTATSSGEYKVVVTTGSGISVTSNKYKVNKKATSSGKDSYKLEITSVSGNVSNWTNKDVTLNVKATSSKGLHSSAYSFDGGKTYQKSSSKSFNKNQTVNIVVRDKNNNKVTYDVYITKMDKTNPKVTITGTKYVNEKLTIKVEPTTAASGYKYQWYYGNTAINGATSASYIPTKTGKYKVKVTTGAGNSKTSTEVTVSNKILPTVSLKGSISSGAISSGVWTNKDVTLKATVTNGTATSYEWYRGSVKLTCKTATCKISSGVGTYKVKAITKDGAITSNTFKVQIDKTAPTLQITATTDKYNGSSKYQAGTTTDKTVYIVAIGVDVDSQIEEIYFQHNNKGVWYYGATDAWDSKSITGSSVIAKVDFTATGTYPFKVKVVDKVGNETIKEHKIVIDKTPKTKPTVSLTGSTSSATWTNKDVTLTATVKDGTATKYEWYKGNSVYTACTTATCKITSAQDATYKVRAVTSSGTTDWSNNYQLKIDKTKPTKPTIKLSSTTETSSNVTFTITNGTDSNSGVSKTQYKIGNGSWQNYSSQVTLLNNTGVKTVYAKTIDKAGNESETVSATGKCDKDAVTVTRKTSGKDSKGCYFILNFSTKNTLTGITNKAFEYAYWEVKQTTDTSNKQSEQWASYCGTQPPSGAKIYKTTTAETIKLYQKYSNQYNCFAVRPVRTTEISGLNRWTVQRKHARTDNSCPAGAYNGN